MKVGELEFKRWYWNWLWKVGWDKGDWGGGGWGEWGCSGRRNEHVDVWEAIWPSEKDEEFRVVRSYVVWGVEIGNSRKEIWEDWLTIPRSLGWFGHQFNKGVARSSVLHGTLMRAWNAFLLRKLLPWSKRDMAKIWIKIMTMRTQGKF